MLEASQNKAESSKIILNGQNWCGLHYNTWHPPTLICLAWRKIRLTLTAFSSVFNNEKWMCLPALVLVKREEKFVPRRSGQGQYMVQ